VFEMRKSGSWGRLWLMANQRDTPSRDAEPQDTEFGRTAAEDEERVERGESPVGSPDDPPRAGGKARPSGEEQAEKNRETDPPA
jgi:hypothetical protein